MNRLLLLAAAILIATAANAQIKRSELVQTPLRPNLQLTKPEAKMEEMQMRTPGTPIVKAPKQADNVRVWYRRPAGAFTSLIVVENGCYAGMLYSPYLAVKPYSDYTFLGFAEGVSDNARYYWEVQHWDDYGLNEREQVWTTVEGKDLTWRWGYETDEVPAFYVIDNGEYYSWYLRGYQWNSPIEATEHRGTLLSVPSTMDIWDFDILKSSKTFGSVYTQSQVSPMVVLSGPDPYGQNEKGWWFGKNGGMGNYRFDGIAQAFEKPEHPYLLKQVVMDCAVLAVAAPVDMYCKIYKIDEIPPYMDEGVATLPEVPGELICRGRATLTPETNDETGGLVFFTLYGEEMGLEYDYTPTIDYPILVVVDGYNDPEMENLKDFSAMIASNFDEDEGFGELAYLKVGTLDEEGMLHLSGRASDVINVGGFKVSPIEVEEAAMSSPMVSDCICISASHPVTGHALKLLIVTPPGQTLDKRTLARFLADRLEPYKVPMLYEQVDTIARTYNGKLDRKYYYSSGF